MLKYNIHSVVGACLLIIAANSVQAVNNYNAIPLQAMKEPLNALNRDQMVGEMLTQMGSTMRCLMNRLDNDINEKLNHLWDDNLERAQKEAIFQLTDNQFMDLVQGMSKITLNKLQNIHPQCSNVPHHDRQVDSVNKLKASKDMENLRDYLEGIGATMKCLLANDKSDTRIHSIFSKAFVNYHGSHDSAKTSLVVTKQELGSILRGLKKLELNCQKVDATPLAIGNPDDIFKRDQMLSEMVGEMGNTLGCLLSILDNDINEKLNHLWDDNLERVQKEAIFKLSDIQFMDLVHDKVMITLKELQSIHPMCTSVPYPCNQNGHENSLKPSKDLEDLRDYLEGIGATMKCILVHGKPDTRIHSIYAKCFVRYHGIYDQTKTSLNVTKHELGNILSDLKKLEANCHMVSIGDVPCLPAVSLTGGDTIIAHGEPRCILQRI